MRPITRILFLAAMLALAGAGPAGAVELVYKPKVGQTVQHKVMIAGRLSLTGSGDELAALLDRRGEMTATIRYSATPTSQSDDSTVVEMRLLEGTAVVKTESATETVNLGTLTATLTTDRRLETDDADFEFEEDLSEVSEEAYAVLDGFPILTGDWWELVDVLYLPAGDVSKGAKWQYEEESELPDGSAQPLVVSYELLDLTSHDGRKCAKIRASWRYEFSDMQVDEGDDAESATTTGSGVYSGDYLIYYDYENSVCAYSEGSIGFDATATMPTPFGEGSATMKALANVKIDIE